MRLRLYRKTSRNGQTECNVSGVSGIHMMYDCVSNLPLKCTGVVSSLRIVFLCLFVSGEPVDLASVLHFTICHMNYD